MGVHIGFSSPDIVSPGRRHDKNKLAGSPFQLWEQSLKFAPWTQRMLQRVVADDYVSPIVRGLINVVQ